MRARTSSSSPYDRSTSYAAAAPRPGATRPLRPVRPDFLTNCAAVIESDKVVVQDKLAEMMARWERELAAVRASPPDGQVTVFGEILNLFNRHTVGLTDGSTHAVGGTGESRASSCRARCPQESK